MHHATAPRQMRFRRCLLVLGVILAAGLGALVVAPGLHARDLDPLAVAPGDFTFDGTVGPDDVAAFEAVLDDPATFARREAWLGVEGALRLADLNDDGKITPTDLEQLRQAVAAAEHTDGGEEAGKRSDETVQTSSPVPESTESAAAGNLAEDSGDPDATDPSQDDEILHFTAGVGETNVDFKQEATTTEQRGGFVVWRGGEATSPLTAPSGSDTTASARHLAPSRMSRGGSNGGGSSGAGSAGSGFTGGGGGGQTSASRDILSSTDPQQLDLIGSPPQVEADIESARVITPQRSVAAVPARTWLRPPQPGSAMIAAASLMAMPDETISITGSGLDQATFEIWVDGRVVNAEVLRTQADRAQVVIPTQDRRGVAIGRGPMWLRPVADGQPGMAIGVNLPQVWWAWPGEIRRIPGRPAPRLRFFGRSLGLGGRVPTIELVPDGSGPPIDLDLEINNEYHLLADLPADIASGHYRVKVTLGESMIVPSPSDLSITVVDHSPPEFETVLLDPPGPDAAFSDAFENTVVEALERGIEGLNLRLSAGVYLIDQRVTLPQGITVRLSGAGMHGQAENLDTNPRTGATVLVVPSGIDRGQNRKTSSAIELHGDGSSVTGLTVVVDDHWINAGIRLMGRHQSVSRVEVVRRGGDKFSSCIASSIGGAAHHRIVSNRLITTSHGVVIENDTDYVRVAECVLRGGHHLGPGLGASAIAHRGGDRFIFESCDIASLDWNGGRIFTRAVLLVDGGIHGGYIANHDVRRVAPNLQIPGIDANSGEIILYHHAGPEGGTRTVSDVRNEAVRLNESANLRPPVDDWMLAIISGEGRGQYRRVSRFQNGWVETLRPWRVQPKRGDRVVLQRGFTEHLVVNNHIDTQTDGLSLRNVGKTAGLMFYFNAVGNIVSGNHFRGLTMGAQVWSRADHFSGWNEIRRNTFNDIGRYTGGAWITPALYQESVQVRERRQLEYLTLATGNAFRANAGHAAPTGASIGWMRQNHGHWFPVLNDESGLLLSIIERNEITGVARSIMIAPPTSWLIYRQNAATRTAGARAGVSWYRPQRVFQPLVESAPLNF